MFPKFIVQKFFRNQPLILKPKLDIEIKCLMISTQNFRSITVKQLYVPNYSSLPVILTLPFAEKNLTCTVANLYTEICFDKSHLVNIPVELNLGILRNHRYNMPFIERYIGFTTVSFSGATTFTF